MGRVIAVLAILASLIASASAQCTPVPAVDAYEQYTVSICPLTQALPVTLTNISVPTFSSVDDGININQIFLPFPIQIYGVEWDRIWMNTNGALFFGSIGYAATTMTFPLSYNAIESLPVIAPYWTDLWMVTDAVAPAVNSQIVHSTQGTPGNRQFIIRYNAMRYYSTRDNANVLASFDIVFFENFERQGDVEIRYYRLDMGLQQSTFYPGITMGMQSYDDGSSYWSLFSEDYFSNHSMVTQQLLGKQLNLHYVGVDSWNMTCGGQGYNLTSLMGADIPYTDNQGNRYFVNLCGEVREPACANAAETEKAMACMIPAAGSDSTTPIDLGVFGPGAIKYEIQPSGSGLNMVMQNGGYCDGIQAQIYTRIQVMCVPTQTTPILVAAAQAPPPCVYILTLLTDRVCGGPTRDNTTVYRPSTLPRCTFTNGAGYIATTCPRQAHSLAPIEQTNPVQVLQNMNNGIHRVALPFPFQFYGQSFNYANISVKGLLTFGEFPYEWAPYGGFPTLGMTNEIQEAWPMIAGYAADLLAASMPGIPEPKITYSTERDSQGRQQFVVRYWDMKFWSTQGLIDAAVSFDIILTQGDFAGQTGIEIKYYVLTPSSNRVSIGIHGPNDQGLYTGPTNDAALTSTLAMQLQGTTVNFTYTGRTAYDACAAYGVNFTNAVNRDMVFTDAASGNTYYVRPCGVLTGANPCRPGTSICQVSRTNVATVLSSFNPSAIIWSPSPAPLLGIRSNLRDGSVCAESGISRSTQIDWVCSRASPFTQIKQITSVSSCTTNIEILTPIACESTAVCSTVRSEEYVGRLCPFSASQPKLALTNESAPILVGLDDDAVRVNIPFKVKIYGASYGRVWVGTNGVLSFGMTRMTSTGGYIPLTGYALDSTPLLAPFWGDLRIIDQSRVTYSNEVVNNTRCFVIRYDQVEWYGNTQDGASDSVSFDVLLFESGLIQFRYYGVNPSSSYDRTVTIGLMSNDETSYLSFMSYRAIDPATAASLSNSTLSFEYIGPDHENAPCGVNTGYELSSLQGRDLTWNNTAENTLWVVSVCAPVRNEACLDASEKTSFCQQYYENGQPTYSYTVAEWEPINTYYQYPRGVNTGVQMVIQGGQMCGSTSRVGVYNFLCDPTATTASVVVVYEPVMCTYFANITTNVVCGPGNRGNTSTGPFLSTLTSCQTIKGRNYDAELCPRTATDQYAFPEPMTNPRRILETNDATMLLNITFPFFIYDVLETQVSVSSNGLITFGYESQASGYPQAFPTMGLTSANYPNVAAFWTDLINYDTTSGVIPYQGFIQYSYEGSTPGQRRMIIRFSDVDYYQGRDSFAERSASFDIILSEGQPGGIEIRYYQIDANAGQNVVIGTHGYRTDYTAVRNLLPINNQLAREIQGTTLRFRYTGVQTQDFCSGVLGGYNISSLSTRDLVHNTSSYTYYFRPCATVTAPDCTAQYTTNRVSLCQATIRATPTSAQFTYALAGDAAVSTSFNIIFGSSGEEILRSTITGGQYCAAIGADRTTIVDYICDRTATNAFISYLQENTTCVYYMRVNTAAACSAPVTCTNYPGNLYNGRLCSANDAMNNKIVQTAPVAILAGQNADEGSFELTLPFNFHIYGQPTNHLFIYSNGYVSFGPVTMSNPWGPLPVDNWYTNGLPMLAAYMCDLNNVNSFSNSSITYSIEGSAPNRFLLVRWSDITYYNWQAPGQGPLLSFDIKLYEGAGGLAEVLYYRIGNLAEDPRNCTIGLQSNDASTFSAIANFVQMPSSLSVENKFVRWYYTGDDSGVTRCGALGYSFVNLMDYEMNWATDTEQIWFKPCGVVQAPTCQNDDTTRRSMVCGRVVNQGYTNNVNMAIYNPSGAVWSIIPGGVQMYMATGQYCWQTNSPSVTFTNFMCEPMAIEPRITSYTSTDGHCVSRITVATNLACGTPPPPPTPPPANSTLPSCYTVIGASYDAEVCPRRSTDPYYYPANFTATDILVGSDNAVDNVQIPFPFSFYGRTFTELNISTNGLLQFGEDSTNEPSATLLGQMPSYIRNWPVIAAFWSDLWNAGSLGEGTQYEGKIQYGVLGDAPNRQFIIRFYMLDYYNYRYYPGVTGVSFDVFLKEGENQDIQIRYYRVDSNPTTHMTIGLRDDSLSQSANTAVQNYEIITNDKARQLSGSTITYRFTGRSAGSACGAFGYSLRDINNADISYSSTANGRTYHLRPCGVVTNPTCVAAPVTEHSSLCEIAGNTPIFSASVFSPSSIQWTQLPNGIESTQQTGSFCWWPLEAPRITTIKYICSTSHVTPQITELTQPIDNECVYNVTVMTAAVCTPVVRSSSSTGPIQPSTAPISSSAVPSSTAPVRSSSSSAAPSSGPVTPSSSSAATPSSSTGPARSSSSSAAPATSTPVTVSSSSVPSVPSSTGPVVVPEGAAVVRFTIELPVGANWELMRVSILQEIVNRLATIHSISPANLATYLTLAFSSTPSRRLLQARQTVSATLTVRREVSNLGVDAGALADTAAREISEGTLISADRLDGVVLPRQQPVVEGGSTSYSSSSSSLSGGAIAGIVIGVIVGVALLAILAFWLCMARSGKGSTRLEDDQAKNGVENSHVGESQVGESAHTDGEEVEMAEV